MIFNFPSEGAKGVHSLLKLVPVGSVGSGVSRGTPNGKGIANVPSAEWKGATKLMLDVKLMDGEVNGGTSWGWWGTHGSVIDLFPAGVAELECILLHHQCKGVKNHIRFGANGVTHLMCVKEVSEF